MATSKLQRAVGNLLDKRLPEFRIRENYRPDWLISSDNKRLELDFFIEEIKLGIEVQGAQHYRFVEFFHRTPEGFNERLRLDREKYELCSGSGVRLVEIFTELDAELIVKEIEKQPQTQDGYIFPFIQSAHYENLANSFLLKEEVVCVWKHLASIVPKGTI